MRRVLLSWSSGKDSAWALYLLRQMPDVQVVALLTSFHGSVDRVAMHAVRRSLAREQARKVDLPLWEVDLPAPCSNTEYEHLMQAVWQRANAEQIREVAFGDLFLEDIRAYRERQLMGTGLKPIFPVWQLPTRELALQMIKAGVKAKVTCIDPAKLDRSFAGAEFNKEFLDLLPAGIDSCGENGEFHTFVHASPVFSSPIAVRAGELVERDGFVFADVLPLSTQVSNAGLCATCSHAKIMTSDRESVFHRCLLAERIPGFSKYPRLPVLRCTGWTASEDKP